MEAQHMRRFPVKAAGPPSPQTPRHCWAFEICDAVVLQLFCEDDRHCGSGHLWRGIGIALSPNAYCGIKGIPLAGASRCIGISIEHELRTDFIVREMLLFYIPRARRPCWLPGGGIHRPSSSLELKGYNEPMGYAVRWRTAARKISTL